MLKIISRHRVEKWSSLIVGALRHRFEGGAQKVLTKTFRRLERNGLLKRAEFPDELVLRAEYSLTALEGVLGSGGSGRQTLSSE